VTFENLVIRIDDGIGWIVVNRPDKLNALNVETMKELSAALADFARDAEVQAIILTGAGEGAFIAGVDVSELIHFDAQLIKEYALQGQELTRSIENSRKPVVAAINGYAFGGGIEIALACHVRVASETAKLGLEDEPDLIPGFGGTQRLIRLVGKGRALDLMRGSVLSGKVIGAKQASDIGLVNKVVAAENILSEAEAMAKEMIKEAPPTLSYAVQSINGELDKTLDDELEVAAQTQKGKSTSRSFQSEIRIRQIEPKKKTPLVLHEPRILIGKRPECHFQIQGVGDISGTHAILTFDEGKWYVMDPGAAKGIRLNGKRIQYNKPVPIQSGAKIRLGQVLIEVAYTEFCFECLDSNGTAFYDVRLGAAHTEPGSVLRVGRGREADIDLPSSKYSDFAQIEFRIFFQEHGIMIDHLSRMNRCEVDGAPFTKRLLGTGEHHMKINDHLFRITVR
jgi:enoyl-CoA hydratase